jgi:hypothetical protein
LNTDSSITDSESFSVDISGAIEVASSESLDIYYTSDPSAAGNSAPSFSNDVYKFTIPSGFSGI